MPHGFPFTLLPLLASLLLPGCVKPIPNAPINHWKMNEIIRRSSSEYILYGEAEKAAFSLARILPPSHLLWEEYIGLIIYRLPPCHFVQFDYTGGNPDNPQSGEYHLNCIVVYNAKTLEEHIWCLDQTSWIKPSLGFSLEYLNEMVDLSENPGEE